MNGWRNSARGTQRGLASIDLTQLSDEQLARISAGEHPFAVLGTPAEPIAALPAGEQGGES